MKSFLMILGLFLCVSSYGQDHVLQFRSDQPDFLIQAGMSSSQKAFYFELYRNFIQFSRNRDLLNADLKLNPMDPIQTGLGLEEYIDKKLIKIIKNALKFDLTQITTTIDLYRMSYRVGHPVLSVLSSQDHETYVDLKFGFKINHLEIDFENIMVNNHSPGVMVTPQDDLGRMWVSGKEKMTLIDDIYIKLVSPSERPLLELDSGNTGISIVSGELSLRLHKIPGGQIQLQYLSHQLNFFDRKSAATLAEQIKVYLGTESKIAGLDAIEYGKVELKLKNDVSGLVQRKKFLLVDLIAEHLHSMASADEVKQFFTSTIDPILINGSLIDSLYRSVSNTYGISTQLNRVGMLNPNSEKPQFIYSSNQSLFWLNQAFQKPDEVPFPIMNPDQFDLSHQMITDEIASGRADAVVSLSQDFINHSILTLTRGQIAFPNDPSTRKDDIIQNGKKGVFLILDQTGSEQGKIVVDVLVQPRFFQKLGLSLLTFKKKIYFPLVITPEVGFEVIHSIPHLVVKVKDFDLTEETLKFGIYGVQSNLHKGILNRVLIQKIRKTLVPMLGTPLFSLPLNQLSGLDPSTVLSIRSDRMGRLNLNLKYSGSEKITEALLKLLQKK
jgi:hypothetical protein